MLAKPDAARAVKRQKALAVAQVIDLSDDKSDDERPKHQAHETDVIDLINSRSPAVALHGRNRYASAAGTSGRVSQPHPSSRSIPQSSSRTAVSSSDNLGHDQNRSSSTVRDGGLSLPRTHSSRKRTASSSDTLDLGLSSTLDQSSSKVPRGAASHVFSPDAIGNLPNPFGTCNPRHSRLRDSSNPHQNGSLGQPAIKPATTRPYLAPSGSTPSEPAGGHIDLVKVTDDYSGALQAADERVQHASTDPALAKALAEKAELEQQLKVELLSRSLTNMLLSPLLVLC